ncbi:MAG: carbamoyl phosphate synthase large subunit, partial [Pseudomonadota bacterium]
IAEQFINMGFTIVATAGTSRFLRERNISNQPVKKVSEGRPHIVDHIKNGEIQLAINTALGSGPARDGYNIRRAVLEYHVPYVTTVAGACAMASGIGAMLGKKLTIKSIQEYHGG